MPRLTLTIATTLFLTLFFTVVGGSAGIITMYLVTAL